LLFQDVFGLKFKIDDFFGEVPMPQKYLPHLRYPRLYEIIFTDIGFWRCPMRMKETLLGLLGSKFCLRLLIIENNKICFPIFTEALLYYFSPVFL
jgi:hypothetical protein